jgi:hypothetical protein
MRIGHWIHISCCKHFDLANVCEVWIWFDIKAWVEFYDGMENEEFSILLWCHWFASLPNISKTHF